LGGGELDNGRFGAPSRPSRDRPFATRRARSSSTRRSSASRSRPISRWPREEHHGGWPVTFRPWQYRRATRFTSARA